MNQKKYKLFESIMEGLISEGAGPYERNPERRGHSNGFKPKRYRTGVGKLELSIPQVRGLKFYPQSLERGCRSERALKLAVAEMYVMGVSTRKVTNVYFDAL